MVVCGMALVGTCALGALKLLLPLEEVERLTAAVVAQLGDVQGV